MAKGYNSTGGTGGTGGAGQSGNGNDQGKNQGQGQGRGQDSNQLQRGDSSPETKVTEVRYTRPEPESANNQQKSTRSGNDAGTVELWVETEDEEILDDCIEPEDPRYQPAPQPQEGDWCTADPNRPEIKKGTGVPNTCEEEVPDNFNGSWNKNDCGYCCGPADTPSGVTTSYMMMNTTISWDKRLTGKLMRGDFSALSKDEFSGKFETQSKSIRDYVGSGTYKGGKATFSYKFNFTIPEGATDVTAFTYTLYDMQNMMQNFDMTFKTNFSNLANAPMGKITAERILVDGSPPTKAYIKSSETNKATVPNIAMKDESALQYLHQLAVNVSPSPSELSAENILLDFVSTIGATGRAIVSFDVDIERALSVKSQYGSVFKNALDQTTRNRIIELSSIDKIEVFRRKGTTGEEVLIAHSSQLSSGSSVKKNTLKTSLFPRTPAGVKEKSDTTKDFILGTVEEHSIYEKDNIRTFVVTDYSMEPETGGETYTYGIKIELKDGTKEALLEKQKDLSVAITDFQKLIAALSNPKFANSVTGRFTESSRKSAAGSTGALNNAIATYIDTLMATTLGVDKLKTADVLYSFANPVSGSPDDMGKVLDLMVSLYDELAKALPTTGNSQSSVENSRLRFRDNFFNNRIIVEHMFDTRPLVFSTDEPKYSAAMTPSATGFIAVSSEQYVQLLLDGRKLDLPDSQLVLRLEEQTSLPATDQLAALGIILEGGMKNFIGDKDNLGLREAGDVLSPLDDFAKNVSSAPSPANEQGSKWTDAVANQLILAMNEATPSIIGAKVEYHSYKGSAMGTKIPSWRPLTPPTAARTKNRAFRCRIKADGVSIYDDVFILGNEASVSSKTNNSSTKSSVLQYLGDSTKVVEFLDSAGKVITAEVTEKTRRKSNTGFF